MLFSRTAAGWCIYHLFVSSNLNFLHISQWITLPTQSCLVLYSFCANLLHSLIIIIIISLLTSFSPQLQLVVFHWSLRDRKSPRVFRTLLSIRVDLRLGLGLGLYDLCRGRESPRSVVANVLDCDIVVSSNSSYVHFLSNTIRKGMNSLILPAIGVAEA